jgi:hypothetical protein
MRREQYQYYISPALRRSEVRMIVIGWIPKRRANFLTNFATVANRDVSLEWRWRTISLIRSVEPGRNASCRPVGSKPARLYKFAAVSFPSVTHSSTRYVRRSSAHEMAAARRADPMPCILKPGSTHIP